MKYIDPADVRQMTGVGPAELAVVDGEAVDVVLTRWIRYTEGIIDDYTGRDWSDVDDEDPRKQKVRAVAELVMRRWVHAARQGRDWAAMVPLDEADNSTPPPATDVVFPRWMRSMLPRPAAKGRFMMAVHHGGDDE